MKSKPEGLAVASTIDAAEVDEIWEHARMRRFNLGLLFYTMFLVCASMRADGPPPPPQVVIATAPLGDLAKKLRYLTRITGEAHTETFEQHWVGRLVNDGRIDGVDTARPAGTVIYMRERPRMQGILGAFDIFPFDIELYGFVPVVNANAFVDAIEANIAGIKEVTPGLWKLQRKPQEDDVIRFCFLKEAQAWCIFANQMAAAKPDQLPQEPGGVLADLAKSYDLALRVSTSGWPTPLDLENSLEPESISKYVGSERATVLHTAYKELDHVTLGFSIQDENTRGACVDTVFAPRAGTSLAARNAALASQAPVSFSGFLPPNAVMSLSLSGRIMGDEITSSTLLLLLRSEREGMGTTNPKDAPRQRLIDVFEKTLASEDDRVGSLVVSLVGEGPVTLIAAARTNHHVALADAIEANILALASSSNVAGVSEQAAKLLDGMRLRSWMLELADVPGNRGLIQAVGGRSVEVLMGLPADSQDVYLAVGQEAYGQLKTARDASLRSNAASARLAGLYLNVRSLARLGEKLLDPSALGDDERALIEQDGGELRVDVECRPSGEFLVRCAVDESALQLLPETTVSALIALLDEL